LSFHDDETKYEFPSFSLSSIKVIFFYHFVYPKENYKDRGTQDPKHPKVFHNFLTFWKKEKKRKKTEVQITGPQRKRKKSAREIYM
jgi:hypothetical protein